MTWAEEVCGYAVVAVDTVEEGDDGEEEVDSRERSVTWQLGHVEVTAGIAMWRRRWGAWRGGGDGEVEEGSVMEEEEKEGHRCGGDDGEKEVMVGVVTARRRGARGGGGQRRGGRHAVRRRRWGWGGSVTGRRRWGDGGWPLPLCGEGRWGCVVEEEMGRWSHGG